MDLDPQMLKGVVSLMLLALVADQEDYGYSLVERLRQSGLDELAEGTVYPALARLERAGLLETYHVPSDRGPARKYYRMSSTGRAELDQRLDHWSRLRNIVDHITKGAEQ